MLAPIPSPPPGEDLVALLEARLGVGSPSDWPARPGPSPGDVSLPRAASLGPVALGAPATGPTSIAANQHLRLLHGLLLAHLGEEERAELLLHLSAQGYRGEPSLQLLEHCARVDDPAALLRSVFTRARLRRIATELGCPADTDPARSILGHLGFPGEAPLRGLSTTVTLSRRAAAELARANPHEDLPPCVTQLAADVELLLRLALEFLAAVVHGMQGTRWARGTQRIDAGQTLHRCSMGKLLELLSFMQHQHDRAAPGSDVGARWELLRRGGPPLALLPPQADRLAPLRNRLVHPPDAGSRPSPFEEARAFVTEAQRLLEHWAAPEPRWFPAVIEIEQVVIDRWRRRLVRARDDAGMPEVLLVDAELWPGDRHLMVGLNNPVRIDPLLVPYRP
jgi:hypothetical protein